MEPPQKVLPLNAKSQESGEILRAPDLGEGIARGAVVELIGSASVDWLLRFLKDHATIRIFWCERDPSLLPMTMLQRGVDPRRITFVRGGNLETPIRRALKNNFHHVIVAPGDFADMATLRALRHLAEEANVVLFLLDMKRPSTATSLRLEIHPKCDADGFSVENLKQRDDAH